MEFEQLSIFNISPPENQETPEVPQHCKMASKSVNFARVSDEEKNQIADKIPPTVDEIVKEMDKISYKAGRYEFLSDLLNCGAIAISNQFDILQAEKREETYKHIINKYDEEAQKLIVKLFGMIMERLTSQYYSNVGFDDYLGQLYMKSGTSNAKVGQFFTPYNVSKLCADMCIGGDIVNQCIEQDEIIRLAEPACGSGGMVLAAVDILYNRYSLNISRNLFVECSDLDARCVNMTYLQLGLAGIPAVVHHRNTLSMETYDTWYTPALLMRWPRFKKFIH